MRPKKTKNWRGAWLSAFFLSTLQYSSFPVPASHFICPILLTCPDSSRAEEIVHNSSAFNPETSCTMACCRVNENKVCDRPTADGGNLQIGGPF